MEDADVHGEIDTWIDQIEEMFDYLNRHRLFTLSVNFYWIEDGLKLEVSMGEDKALVNVWKNGKFPMNYESMLFLVQDCLCLLGFDIWIKPDDLLMTAIELNRERKNRLKIIENIRTNYAKIFENEESKKVAEEAIFREWVKAMEINGWFISVDNLLELTKLPLFSNGEILIYHNPNYDYPRYYRVWKEEDGMVKLEKIEATQLSEIVRSPNIERVKEENLRFDEIVTVAKALADITARMKVK